MGVFVSTATQLTLSGVLSPTQSHNLSGRLQSGVSIQPEV